MRSSTAFVSVLALLTGGALGDERNLSEITPLLEGYCIDCHSTENQKGDLDLERFQTITDLRADTGVWQKVFRQIEDGEMPPKNKAQPTVVERGVLLKWTREFLDSEARRNAGDPGPTVLRRLNNAEYTYTIRDLTGVESLDPAREFPADGAAGEGFTNAAAALSMSPALVEKYLAAAKEVASHAVLLPNGFRFEEGNTRQDWSNALVERIRAIYLRHTGGGEVDFSYRSQIGSVAPVSAAEGKIDISPYFAAIRSGNLSGVNVKYATSLRDMLEARSGGNSLLDELRALWVAGESTEQLAEAVRRWQGVLWKFNAIGTYGRMRPWQGAVDPLKVGETRVRSKIEPGQRRLYLAAPGDGATRWKNPRFVKAGREPLPLASLAEVGDEFARLRDRELPRSAEYLRVLFEVRGKASVDLEALANRRGLDPRLLKAWGALVGLEVGPEIRDYFTQFKVRDSTPSVGSWEIPGVGDLSLVGNAGDTDLLIPGFMGAGKIAVHPRPERPVAVSWRSPVAAEVTISGAVNDAHDNCGNGVRWSLESKRGGLRRSLAGGDVDLGQGTKIVPIEGYHVVQGELVTLVIDSRDNNHVCDLTQIDLVVEGAGKRWSLSEDCAKSLGDGNPHSDRYGMEGVWHFYSPPPGDVSKPGAVIPPDSALARWIRATDAEAADKAAREMVAGGKMFGLNLRGASGWLFGAIDWGGAGTGGAIELAAEEVREFALPEGLFDGWEFVAEGIVVGEGGVQFVAAGERPTGLKAGVPISVAGEGVAAQWHNQFDEFRDLFPIAVSYTRIVPIDEVVTLLLFHREDEAIKRLMLSADESAELDRLWAELYFVSDEPRRLVTGYEQLWQFATQDSDPSKIEPLEAGVRERAAAFERQLIEAEPLQLDALMALARRGYRGAFEASDEELLRRLYRQLRDSEKGHAEAFRLTLARVLSSPKLLFKGERAVPGEGSAPVSRVELANRTSYFLWSSMPDGELLSEPGSHQALRMLRDPKSRRLAVEFACQWLGLRDFDQFDEKSETQFPEFVGLRGAMYEEAVSFFADLFAENRSVLSILDADHAFVSPELAAFYQLGASGRVDGMRERGRGGVLGMAAALAKQSGASRTSPILRGNWVYEVLLGEHLPKPPKSVPVLPDSPPVGLSERQLIERHSSAPECARCHEKIDPYGFSLEAFDAIGRARGGAETTAVLPGGIEIEGIAGLRDYLVVQRRDDFVRQFCRKLLGFALGRGVMLSDEPLVEAMMADLAIGDYRVGIAIDKILTSRQFCEIRKQPSP